METARPWSVHRLRADGQTALCLRGGDRAWRPQCPSAGAAGARRAHACPEARHPGTPAGISREFGGRIAMSVHSYDDRRRPASLSHKLSEVNWRLVVLITLIACAGFAMLYSAAGGSFSPWAERQMIRFVVGVFILLAVACVDLRVWMELAYPAYLVSLLLLVGVEVAGRVGLGAQRWLELGPLQLQPSEPMKIALVLALSRFLQGLTPGEVSRPTKLLTLIVMMGVPVVLVLHEPNLGTATLLALCV